MIEIATITTLLVLLSSWQYFFDYACDRFIDIEDPDDWVGREAEWCQAQMDWACKFADDRCDDDDDDECSHPSETQAADGAFYCDKCGTMTYDITDEEFNHQMGNNFTGSDWVGW